MYTTSSARSAIFVSPFVANAITVPPRAFTSAILSKGYYPPYLQTIMGAGLMIKPIRTKLGLDPVFQKYVKSGALQNSLVTFDRTYFDRSIKEYFTKTKPINYIKNFLI